MKPKLNLHFFLALSIALVASYALYSATDWPFRTALFPRMIAVPLLVLALIEMGLSAFATEKQREGHAVDFELTTEIDPLVARQRTLAIVGWILGFFILILLIGFPVGVPVFVFSYLKLGGKEKWGLALILTTLSWLVMKGLFDRLLHIPFPDGWIPSLFG
ncbi:MAG: tripartite tricarboxylate transporter TctB family protein [Candidatus Omnitrophota bacterium]|nr:tripartite tricarboxylate transporter TctB family protein [Candidatus Omnitrophota bacterium]MDZ4345779.1 tripartite tricarboxylate transporter TctB family protein [Candidatus Binatia bacterium]